MEPLECIANYTILSKLGEGSFGQIFQAKKDGQQYAIKTERITIVKPMLVNEYTILKELALEGPRGLGHLQSPKGFGFPLVYQYEEREYFSYMVMEKLDTTLQDLANLQMDNKIPKDVLLLVMYNTLKCLQWLHQVGYLYRDVKPSNFMVRQIELQQGSGRIYLIDLGLSKKYTRNENGQHIKFRNNKKMVGTPIFCSLHTHKGLENSRRDDLESWVYMIIYLVKKLPWEDYSLRKNFKNKPETAEEKNRSYEMIGKVKQETNLVQLMKQDQTLPSCLTKIIEQIKGLSFESRPNYQLIETLIQQEYSKLTGIKTPLWEVPFRVHSQIPDPTLKKTINFSFKIPQPKKKQPAPQAEHKQLSNPVEQAQK